jgi:hypothetical protein
MRAQAQSWVMPNVFNVGNVAERLIWTRMNQSGFFFLETEQRTLAKLGELFEAVSLGILTCA